MAGNQGLDGLGHLVRRRSRDIGDSDAGPAVAVPTLDEGGLKGCVLSHSSLSLVVESKHLGIFFTSEGRMERETDGRAGAASAVVPA